MTLAVDGPLYDLTVTIGELPGGDGPAAWYASVDDEVVATAASGPTGSAWDGATTTPTIAD